MSIRREYSFFVLKIYVFSTHYDIIPSTNETKGERLTKDENRFDRQLFTMTTIIKSTTTKDGTKYSSQGSAFYYNEVSPADPQKTGPQWYKIEKHWLVTNRHVALPKIDDIECVPETFTFCLRRNNGGSIEWFPITLTMEQLLGNLKLHRDEDVFQQ